MKLIQLIDILSEMDLDAEVEVSNVKDLQNQSLLTITGVTSIDEGSTVIIKVK